MKTNTAKRKLAAGEPTFGTWLSLGDLYSPRGCWRGRASIG